jgi:hypothetical protein
MLHLIESFVRSLNLETHHSWPFTCFTKYAFVAFHHCKSLSLTSNLLQPTQIETKRARVSSSLKQPQESIMAKFVLSLHLVLETQL